MKRNVAKEQLLFPVFSFGETRSRLFWLHVDNRYMGVTRASFLPYFQTAAAEDFFH